MVGFAGYDMPVQYRDGVLKEHLWTRAHAGIFDVSHMGRLQFSGKDATAFLNHFCLFVKYRYPFSFVKHEQFLFINYLQVFIYYL